MATTMISSARSDTVLPASQRRAILAYYQKLVDETDTYWAFRRTSTPYRDLTPAEEATMLRALFSRRIRKREDISPVEVLLGHKGLSVTSLGKIVRSAPMEKGHKAVLSLLTQENLTDLDRFIGLVRYVGASHQSYKLVSDNVITRKEMDLVEGVSNHWGYYSYVPLPEKIAREIMFMTDGQKEILTVLLKESPTDMWDHGPRQKRFREILRLAQDI